MLYGLIRQGVRCECTLQQHVIVDIPVRELYSPRYRAASPAIEPGHASDPGV